jgi:hypothetical protein
MKMSSLYLASSVALAGASGALGAVALTNSTAQAPTSTVTINAATGATGPAGPQGPPGPPGQGIVMKGTVPTKADLPATGNTQGDTYVTSNDGVMYVWDGTKWVSGGPVGGTGSGPEACPTGSTFKAVVINADNHVEIWTCVKNT